MGRGTWASGNMIRPTGMGNCFMRMAMCMRACGLRIRRMGKEFTLIITGPRIKATGKMINKTDLGRKFGLMELNMKETSFKEEKKEKGH